MSSLHWTDFDSFQDLNLSIFYFINFSLQHKVFMQISFTINIKLVVQILYFEFFTRRLLNPRKSPKWLKKFYRSIKGSKTIKENSPKSIEVQRRWANHSEIVHLIRSILYGPCYMSSDSKCLTALVQRTLTFTIFENNCWYFRIYDIKYGVPTDREIEFPDDESSTGW